MKRRTFIPCLNRQRKIYNFSVGSLIGCVIGFVICGLSKGILWGLAGAGIGFSLGNWIAGMVFKGYLQRFLYWNFPYAKDWLGRNVPESSEKEEL